MIDKDIVTELYNSGLAATKIAKKLGIGTTSVYRILDKKEVKRRSFSKMGRRYTTDDNMFTVIDTEQKAYIYGFILADGCNTISKRRNSIRINLAIKDIDILEKIRNIISPESPVTIKTSKPPRQDVCSLAVYNKQISSDLNSHGITINKTYTTSFPYWMDNSLIPHFIRGHFDGDGSIMFPTYNNLPKIDITGRMDLLVGIQKVLIDQLSLSCTKIRKDSSSEVVYHLGYSGTDNCSKIRRYIYQNATIYMNRKYALFHTF